MTNQLIFVSKYEDYLKDILKEIDEGDRVCYITLNKTYDLLERSFKKINFRNVHFIDGISKVIGKSTKAKNCDFVEPYELNKILKLVKRAIKNKCNIIVIDSISNMINFGKTIQEICKILKEISDSFKRGRFIVVCYKIDEERISNDRSCINIFREYKKSFLPMGASNR
jgi:KaiC/GvpD/RAD55 family RecA-like ATPase